MGTMQQIITAKDGYRELNHWLETSGCRKVLLVCDSSIHFLAGINNHLAELSEGGLDILRFSDFQPNPLYESVVKGVALFRERECDSIMAIGGGSAMDVAKCIKLYSNLPGTGDDGEFLRMATVPNEIPFLAMPTTAGTGSEATRYAVIYYQGEKQSVTNEQCIPETVLMDPSVLVTLPLYQKKATMMDAFCHALESFWSVNSTAESRAYSHEATQLVLKHMEGYLANRESDNAGMLHAAHIAGQAINITQTTAGHAMCYKITSLFGCAHGHAAVLCDQRLFPWMVQNLDKCVDPRGRNYLEDILQQISSAMGCSTTSLAVEKVNSLVEKLNLTIPIASAEQFVVLKNSVNPVRLKNHPVALDSAAIDTLYHRILHEEGK